VSEVPSGTVTFLFTDLEVSTRLWEQEPEAMRGALARHDEILRDAVVSGGGRVVKGTGDGVHAAFATAEAALTVAIDSQLALAAEQWDVSEPLRVRMGLHTGVAEARDNDYFGSEVNRAARLMAVGHGGQILVSDVTEPLVREVLPEGVAILDLGMHRLRDLAQPLRVFQVQQPSLPSRFPALRTLEGFPNNLPEQMTSLVGRACEIAEIREALRDARLVTLTGAAGCGKTRLALQTAAESLDDFEDGAWFVDLAPVADPELVAQTVASTLGLRDTSVPVPDMDPVVASRPLEDLVMRYFGSRRLLLVLDNCEHVIAASARFADRVLRACGGVRIVATSREPLGISGERTWRVPSLTIPDRAAVASGHALDFDAARLFVDRARLREPRFVPSTNDETAIVEICERLDGIPLAIELAAARVTVLSCAQIAERLDDRFRFLTGGARTALERHQTLRAAVDWSYNSLTEPERGLLARLSVFAGGFTLDAAEVVCADLSEAAGVFDTLVGLIDKSLVVADPSGGRYRLLETIRQYAREKLLETGDADELRVRHRDFFAGVALSSADEQFGPNADWWLELLAADHANLHQALEWAIVSEAADVAQAVAADLGWYWAWGSSLVEGRDLLGRVLALTSGEALPSRVRCLALAANAEAMRLDLQAADTFLAEALSLARRLGDAKSLAITLNAAAFCAQIRSDHPAARAAVDEALGLARGAGLLPYVVHATFRGTAVAMRQNDVEAARSYGAEGLAAAHQLDYKRMITGFVVQQALLAAAFDHDHQTAAQLLEEVVAQKQAASTSDMLLLEARLYLGQELMQLGQLERARTLTEDALNLAHDTANALDENLALTYLGNIEAADGQPHDANRHYRAAITQAQDVRAPSSALLPLHAFARLAAATGECETAAQLLAAVESSLADRSDPTRPVSPRIAPQHRETVDTVRTALGDPAFQVAWSTGTALTLEDAMDLALGDPRVG
jgi:predicted ATPase/class 3 adenylate cyclase